MKKIKFISVFALTLTLMISCKKREVADEIQETTFEPTGEQLDKLFALGVNTNDVVIKDITTLDGKTSKYLVAKDILVPETSLDSLPDLRVLDNDGKEYTEENLVSKKARNINILGYTGRNNTLTSKMQTALRWAVNNYNSLSNSLHFNLSFGADYDTADIVVYLIDTTDIGGNSGFPDVSGQPYKWIQIYSGTSILPTNISEYVISHQIGHAIGLRHQDWHDNHSCGYLDSFSSDLQSIKVSGKSIPLHSDSMMMTCPSLYENGELTDIDKALLNALY